MKCPECGSPEIEAYSPRTHYGCGSHDYDQRPGTFQRGPRCTAIDQDKMMAVQALSNLIRRFEGPRMPRLDRIALDAARLAMQKIEDELRCPECKGRCWDMDDDCDHNEVPDPCPLCV